MGERWGSGADIEGKDEASDYLKIEGGDPRKGDKHVIQPLGIQEAAAAQVQVRLCAGSDGVCLQSGQQRGKGQAVLRGESQARPPPTLNKIPETKAPPCNL